MDNPRLINLLCEPAFRDSYPCYFDALLNIFADQSIPHMVWDRSWTEYQNTKKGQSCTSLMDKTFVYPITVCLSYEDLYSLTFISIFQCKLTFDCVRNLNFLALHVLMFTSESVMCPCSLCILSSCFLLSLLTLHERICVCTVICMSFCSVLYNIQTFWIWEENSIFFSSND